LPKSVYFGIKKRQYVRKNKTRSTTKFIQNQANRAYKPWAAIGYNLKLRFNQIKEQIIYCPDIWYGRTIVGNEIMKII